MLSILFCFFYVLFDKNLCDPKALRTNNIKIMTPHKKIDEKKKMESYWKYPNGKTNLSEAHFILSHFCWRNMTINTICQKGLKKNTFCLSILSIYFNLLMKLPLVRTKLCWSVFNDYQVFKLESWECPNLSKILQLVEQGKARSVPGY